MKTLTITALLIFVLAACGPAPTEQPAIPTATSAPTLSSYPFLDFDHPRLHEIAGDKSLIIREIVRTRRHFDGTQYVAVIVDTGDPVLAEKMLIFRWEKSSAILIYELAPYYYVSFKIIAEDPGWLVDNFNYYFYSNVMGGIANFGSNYLEIPVNVSYGGNCYDCTQMKVIGITKDGIAKDVTPEFGFAVKTFLNLGKNLEVPFYIIATHYYEFDYGACDHVSSPFAFRLFAWNGKAYVDVSEDEKDFYDQKIAELTSNIQSYWGKPLHSCWVMPTLANIFFDYELSGRVEYGWKQIQELGDLSHWDIQNTPPEEIQSYHEVFDLLEQRYKQPAQ